MGVVVVGGRLKRIWGGENSSVIEGWGSAFGLISGRAQRCRFTVWRYAYVWAIGFAKQHRCSPMGVTHGPEKEPYNTTQCLGHGTLTTNTMQTSALESTLNVDTKSSVQDTRLHSTLTQLSIQDNRGLSESLNR